MKILITGANGMLGQKLIGQLEETDHAVIATGRGENRNPTGTYVYDRLDVTQASQVSEVVGKHKPDIIINCAAMTHVDQCETDRDGCKAQNVDAVRYLVDACLEQNIYLAHLSTDFIFDGAEGPYTEEGRPNPLSYYGETKLEAEKIILASGIKAGIARTILVYGVAHDVNKSNIVLWVKNSLEACKHIKVVNDQWRTPTLADDLAKGCILMAEGKHEGVFNLSGFDLLTPYDIAIATAKHFKLDESLIEEVDGSIFTQPAKRPVRTGFVLDKAIDTFGYSPTNFSEGLAVIERQLDARQIVD